MLHTSVRGRQTGKTREIIEKMTEDLNVLVIVPHKGMKEIYPRGLHRRVFTAEAFISGMSEGMDFNKIILDEGFSHNPRMMAELYYCLGSFYKHCYIHAIGTIN